MTIIRTAALIGLFVFSAPLGAAEEQSPQAVFDALFGPEVQRVTATASSEDDLALAKSLLGAARTYHDRPALVAVMCERVGTLAGKDPAGVPVAIEAAALVARLVPERRVEALTRIADLRQRIYTAARGGERAAAADELIAAMATLGDAHLEQRQYEPAAIQYRKANAIATSVQSKHLPAIKARLERVLARQTLDKQIQSLRARIEGGDRAAGPDLVKIYLVEFDDPAEARKYAFLTDDPAMATNIRNATRPVAELDATASFEMGEWYRGLAAEARFDVSKAAMLKRAAAHYEQFLQQHPAEGLVRTKANLASNRVQQDLAALNIADIKPLDTSLQPIDPSAWIDALAVIDVTKHTNRGEWVRQDAALVGSNYRNVLTPPLSFTGGDEFEWAVILREADSAGLALPLGTTGVSLVIQRSPELVGSYIMALSRVDVHGAFDEENPTRTTLALNPLAEQKIAGRVEFKEGNVQITVLLADQPVIDWVGSPVVLGYDNRRPGSLGAVVVHGNRGITIQKLRFRALDGVINRENRPAMAGDRPRPMGGEGEGELDEATKAKLEAIRAKFFQLPYDVQKRIIVELQASPHPEARELARELLNRF